MTDHDRPNDQEDQGRERPRIRVTDKRRLHADEPVTDPSGSPRHAADPSSEDGGVGHPADDSGLDHARAEAAEYREHLQRLQAEFDNFRKRTLREQTHALDRAAEPLVRRLLEVLDEFDLALMAADRTPDLQQFLRGVELVYAKLQDILEAEGLQRIDALGKPFDPEFHEALMHSDDAEGEGAGGEPIVADVFRQGYTLKGKVLRPAGVRVGTRPGK
jgi:molecular chaperone GrpE